MAERWGVLAGGVDFGIMLKLLPIPVLGLAGLATVIVGLMRRSHGLPYIGAAVVFLSGYLGLRRGFSPFVVPYALTFADAASANNALS